jgi:hypothetical protein
MYYIYIPDEYLEMDIKNKRARRPKLDTDIEMYLVSKVHKLLQFAFPLSIDAYSPAVIRSKWPQERSRGWAGVGGEKKLCVPNCVS